MRIPFFIHLPGAVARFRAWRQDRRTLAAVATLDDAALRDIGLQRWDLTHRR